MNDSLNKLIEISGEGSIILRALCDFTLDNIKYKTGDIVYFIPSCNINCVYNSTTINAKKGLELQLAQSTRYLTEVRLNHVHMTEKLLRIFNKVSGDSVAIPKIEKAVAFLGQIFLTETPSGLVRVYDPFGNLVGTYDSEEEVIEDPNFETDVPYVLLYEVLRQAPVYDINTLSVDIPYLSLDVIIGGNVDKKAAGMSLHINRVGINAVPVINMFGSNLTLMDLRLNVVDSPVLLSVI